MLWRSRRVTADPLTRWSLTRPPRPNGHKLTSLSHYPAGTGLISATEGTGWRLPTLPCLLSFVWGLSTDISTDIIHTTHTINIAGDSQPWSVSQAAYFIFMRRSFVKSPLASSHWTGQLAGGDHSNSSDAMRTLGTSCPLSSYWLEVTTAGNIFDAELPPGPGLGHGINTGTDCLSVSL